MVTADERYLRGLPHPAPHRFGAMVEPEAMAHLHDRVDDWQKVGAELGEAVLDRGRRGRQHLAVDDALLLEDLEACREHLCRDPRDVSPQLAEAPRPAAQVPDHVRRPGAAEERHAGGERALGRRLGDVTLADFQTHGVVTSWIAEYRLDTWAPAGYSNLKLTTCYVISKGNRTR